MATADYCDYKLSLALKAAGFDEPCDHYYTPNKAIRIVKDNALAPEITNNRFLDEIADGCCTAVSLWQAQKWLREGARLYVGLTPAIPTLKWQFYIDDLGQHVNPYDGELLTCVTEEMQEEYDKKFHNTYEAALSAGISSALDLLAGKEGKG